jgi:hypothetical protein
MWLQIGMDLMLKLLQKFINQTGLAVQSWLLFLYFILFFSVLHFRKFCQSIVAGLPVKCNGRTPDQNIQEIQVQILVLVQLQNIDMIL